MFCSFVCLLGFVFVSTAFAFNFSYSGFVESFMFLQQHKNLTLKAVPLLHCDHCFSPMEYFL